jgi:tripartite-type tricarboxylate transporter receptor subunit TctC
VIESTVPRDNSQRLQAPPGVPESRVHLLRQAFLNTLQDPKLEEEANRLDLDINPLAGEEVQNVIAELKHLSSEVKQKARNFLEQP